MNKKKSMIFSVLFNLIFFAFCLKINCQNEPQQNDKKPEQLSKLLDVLKTPEKNPEEKINSSEKIIKKPQEKKEEKQKKQNNNKDDKFELNFENVALKNVLDYISDLFDVTFLPDDAITDEKKLKGINDVKVTFKSHKPFTQQQVWNFLDSILEIAGLSRISLPGMPGNFYRITVNTVANKSNLKTFFGVDPDTLPGYERIRYVYFLLNKQVPQIRDVISKFISKNAQLEIFQELNALIFTDIGYNIKSLMQIAKALDSTELPEVISVLKLKSADANDVAKLYETLKGKDDLFRPFGESKKGLKITQDTKVIAEPRTNALIILGPKDTVQRIEKFVTEHIDKSLVEHPTKLHSHKLHYVPAEQVANILNDVTKFGAESEAAKFGGIREGEKYLNKMFFKADKEGNNLIIRGDKEDYEAIKDTINQLDQVQEQIAVEVLIVSVDLDDAKAAGAQIRNKNKGKLNYQTSGFFNQGIQTDPVTGSIVANLIGLVQGAKTILGGGTTVLTLGKVDVWAVLGIVSQTSEINILSNPFLVITNKYTSTVSVGETRRVPTAQVQGGQNITTNEFGDIEANLTVTITPQINLYGIINLDVDIKFDNFTIQPPSPSTTELSNADKQERRLHTNANLGDREVLAIGGLIKTTDTTTESRVPILSSIPIIGTLFKNKSVFKVKTNLLVFITPRIIKAHREPISSYTKNKANIIAENLLDIKKQYNNRDPINRWFFQEEAVLERNKNAIGSFVPLEIPDEQVIKKEIINNKKSSKCSLINSVVKGKC